MTVLMAILVSIGTLTGTGGTVTFHDTTGTVNQCHDGIPVTVDVRTGNIYGDQNHDGILSGNDCDWT